MSATSDYLTDLRDALYTRIGLDVVGEWFTNNDFDLEKTWFPETGSLEHLRQDHPDGIVYIVGGMAGDEQAISRSNATSKEYSVKVGFQVYVEDMQSTTEVDPHVMLVQELQEVCRKRLSVAAFTFNRIETLKDENGVPFDYTASGKNIFEAYFTAYYTSPIA